MKNNLIMRYHLAMYFFQYIRFYIKCFIGHIKAERWAKKHNLVLSKEKKKDFRKIITWTEYKERNSYWFHRGDQVFIISSRHFKEYFS